MALFEIANCQRCGDKLEEKCFFISLTKVRLQTHTSLQMLEELWKKIVCKKCLEEAKNF